MGKYIILFVFALLRLSNLLYAQTPFVVTDAQQIIPVTSSIEFLEDPTHALDAASVIASNKFVPSPAGIPNFGVTRSAYWLRIKVVNASGANRLIVKLGNPLLDTVEFFEQRTATDYRKVVTGQSRTFLERQYLSSDYLFSFDAPANQEHVFYLRLTNSGPLLVPVTIGAESIIMQSDKYKDIFWGIYIGVMLAMLLYNLFVYITTKDRSYLYYIAYVVAVIITQITLSGYGFQLLWPFSPVVARFSTFIGPVMVGLAGIEFMRHFLKTKNFLPRADKGFYLFITTYILGGVFASVGMYNVGFGFIDATASTVSIFMLILTIIIVRQGYRPAYFFLISWIVFLIGIFIFVFKNFNILPYNNFTVYTMPVGSAMEVILLSFALADRINILKKEKEASQAQAMNALKENERIVREQNVMLEKKVDERTHELLLSNRELNKAMKELKEAETQLVESEKMASLGQLTAGIAHEINNPINFVTSNVKPLNRDVNILLNAVDEMERMIIEHAPAQRAAVDNYKQEIDYEYLKEEIDQLLTGIGDGASRTAEIVKGLRIFSRLDEDDLKKADINEGMNSTLVITNNLLNNLIKVDKKYGNIPVVECYPGKLNQVFLNIISNGIYAVKKKFGDQDGGVITISTRNDDDFVYVSIADNGIGMDESTKKRLFEPFFTTKEVGEGTGLGMSIAYNTINKHNGVILINSELGVGTEFIIKLPLIQK